MTYKEINDRIVDLYEQTQTLKQEKQELEDALEDMRVRLDGSGN